MMSTRHTTRVAYATLLRRKPLHRTFTSKPTESSQRLAAHRAKEADRRAKKAELLLDLQALQDKSRQVINRERSWSEAIRATIKVAKPQLINMFATFACVVISAQMLVLRKDHQALQQKMEDVRSERDELKKQANIVCGDEFLKNISVKCCNVFSDAEEEKYEDNSGWFGFGGGRRRQDDDESDGDSAIDDQIASVIRGELKHVFRLVQLSSGENTDNNDAIMHELEAAAAEDEAKMIQELIRSTSSGEVEEGEVVSVEEGKVVRRKKFVM